MDKHLTGEEKAERLQAEREAGVGRSGALTMPACIKGDSSAKKYWNQILERMEGLAILDSLDSEVLAVYCAMLSRRDKSNKLLRALMAQASKPEADPEKAVELLDKIESLTSKLQGQERMILSYADKLGLTPTGRVALARRRSAAAAKENDPDIDLFGEA